MPTLYQKRNNQLVQVAPSTDVTKKFNDAKDKLDQIEAAGGYVLPPATTTTLGGVKVDNQTTFTDSDGTLYTRITPVAPSDDVPAELQDSPYPGVSTDFSRADHVHPAQDMTMDAGGGAKNVVIDTDLHITAEHERKLLVMANKPGLKIFLPDPATIEPDGVSYVFRVTGDYDVTVVNHRGGAVGDGNGVCAVNKMRIFVLLDTKGTWMSSEWEGFIPVEPVTEGVNSIELGAPLVYLGYSNGGAARHDENNATMLVGGNNATDPVNLYYLKYDPTANAVSASKRAGTTFDSSSNRIRNEISWTYIGEIEGYSHYWVVDFVKNTSAGTDVTTFYNHSCWTPRLRILSTFDNKTKAQGSSWSSWYNINTAAYYQDIAKSSIRSDSYKGNEQYVAMHYYYTPPYICVMTPTRSVIGISQPNTRANGNGSSIYLGPIDVVYGSADKGTDTAAGASITSNYSFTNANLHKYKILYDSVSNKCFIDAMGKISSSSCYVMTTDEKDATQSNVVGGRRIYVVKTDVTPLLSASMTFKTTENNISLWVYNERLYIFSVVGTTKAEARTLTVTRVDPVDASPWFTFNTICTTTLLPAGESGSGITFTRISRYDADGKFAFYAYASEKREYVYFLFDPDAATITLYKRCVVDPNSTALVCKHPSTTYTKSYGTTIPYGAPCDAGFCVCAGGFVSECDYFSLNQANGGSTSSGSYGVVGDCRFAASYNRWTSIDAESAPGQCIRENCVTDEDWHSPLGATSTSQNVNAYLHSDTLTHLRMSPTTYLLFGHMMIAGTAGFYIIPMKVNVAKA